MSKIRAISGMIVLMISIILLILPFGQQVAADSRPDYAISRYDILIQLAEDGSALVRESISYDVKEDLRDYQYRIYYEDAGGIELQRIFISEANKGDEPAFYIEAMPAEPGQQSPRPMTYNLQDSGQSLQIRLHVFSETDTNRTVWLYYKLNSVAERHLDEVRLQLRCFDLGIRGTIPDPKVTIILPDGQTAASDDVWSLPVSMADFAQDPPLDNRFTYRSQQLQDKERLILVLLVPPEWIPDAPSAETLLSREELITAAETLLQTEQTEAARHLNIIRYVMALLAASGVFALLIYFFFDHETAAQYHQQTSRQVPDHIPPVVPALLLRRGRPSRLILATLFDLVRRGALKREGYLFIRTSLAAEPYIGFKAYEIFLITWLFDHIASDDHLSVSDIRRYARDPGTNADFRAYFHQFRLLVRESLLEPALLDARKTELGRILCRILFLAYGISAAGIALIWHEPSAWYLLLPACAFLIYSLTLRRLNRRGCELYARSLALYRGLKQPHKLDPALNSRDISRALPLAIAFGQYHTLLDCLLTLEDDSADPISRVLEIYQLDADTSWQSAVRRLQTDLQVMESLISASILLAGNLHS